MTDPLNIESVNSNPTIVLPELERVRVGELATELRSAVQRGYLQANVLTQLLDLAKMLIPLLAK